MMPTVTKQDDEAFGAWLAAERARLRVSLGAVARHARISDETVRRAEQGQRVVARTRDAIEDAIAIIDALSRAAGDRRLDDLEAAVRSLTAEVAALRDDRHGGAGRRRAPSTP